MLTHLSLRVHFPARYSLYKLLQDCHGVMLDRQYINLLSPVHLRLSTVTVGGQKVNVWQAITPPRVFIPCVKSLVVSCLSLLGYPVYCPFSLQRCLYGRGLIPCIAVRKESCDIMPVLLADL